MMKKYKQLFKQIEKDILDERYAVGDFLPSEHQLTEDYQVSRDTVRKALALLQEEGLIEKVRGQGSKIIKQEQFDFPVSKLTSYQEVVKQNNMQSKPMLSAWKDYRGSETVRHHWLPPYRLVWRIVRQRVVDQVASVLDIDYLDKGHRPWPDKGNRWAVHLCLFGKWLKAQYRLCQKRIYHWSRQWPRQDSHGPRQGPASRLCQIPGLSGRRPPVSIYREPSQAGQISLCGFC